MNRDIDIKYPPRKVVVARNARLGNDLRGGRKSRQSRNDSLRLNEVDEAT